MGLPAPPPMEPPSPLHEAWGHAEKVPTARPQGLNHLPIPEPSGGPQRGADVDATEGARGNVGAEWGPQLCLRGGRPRERAGTSRDAGPGRGTERPSSWTGHHVARAPSGQPRVSGGFWGALASRGLPDATAGPQPQPQPRAEQDRRCPGGRSSAGRAFVGRPVEAARPAPRPPGPGAALNIRAWSPRPLTCGGANSTAVGNVMPERAGAAAVPCGHLTSPPWARFLPSGRVL